MCPAQRTAFAAPDTEKAERIKPGCFRHLGNSAVPKANQIDERCEMMSKGQVAARTSAAFDSEKLSLSELQLDERWNSRLDDARKLVAAQIVESLKSKWGTAVALHAATGICQTEMSRIRHGKIDRFSLERLVRLLWIVDPDVDVELEVKVVAHSATRSDQSHSCLPRRRLSRAIDPI